MLILYHQVDRVTFKTSVSDSNLILVTIMCGMDLSSLCILLLVTPFFPRNSIIFDLSMVLKSN